MTPDEINKLLAEKLMGYHYVDHPFYQCGAWLNKENHLVAWGGWDPCHNITQALGDGGPGTVVGKMLRLGWDFRIALMQGTQVYAEFCHYPNYPDNSAVFARADTPAIAICEAAVKVLGGK